jgi:hypothetical protein
MFIYYVYWQYIALGNSICHIQIILFTHTLFIFQNFLTKQTSAAEAFQLCYDCFSGYRGSINYLTWRNSVIISNHCKTGYNTHHRDSTF